MKIFNRTVYLIAGSAFLLLAAGCSKENNFGNDRGFSGTMQDGSGNIVAGDITSTGFLVKALGTGDVVSTDMVVKGDGTYGNSKLYAKSYKIWVSGPVTSKEDTLVVDLSQNNNVSHNFVVVPFIGINKPEVAGNLTETTVDISYAMAAASDKTISKRELYCATYPFPNTIIGSAASYTTVKVTLNDDSGTITVSGLVSKTTYFIRIGALAKGSNTYNFSDQIEITTL